VDRLGRAQMPAIDHCHAAVVLGVDRQWLDGCPLIHAVPAEIGCRGCAPWLAAATIRDEEIRETGLAREICAIAAEWQPCPFIADWRFAVACDRLGL